MSGGDDRSGSFVCLWLVCVHDGGKAERIELPIAHVQEFLCCFFFLIWGKGGHDPMPSPWKRINMPNELKLVGM